MLCRIAITASLILLLAGVALASPLASTRPDKPIRQVTPPPIDPEVVRQGGDTFFDAFAVPVGYVGTGTTVGYTDDYDEACPYDGSTSPDVVYRLTPDHDVTVTIDLLGSTYDTKVYVYDDAGYMIACNDDYYPDYVSRLESVDLLVGSAYHVVIDGYGGAAGDYVVAITEVVPYEATCLYGGAPTHEEDEPPLAVGYTDSHNGGCNSPEYGSPMQILPVATWSMTCFHGRSGWYVDGAGDTARDTDWFVGQLDAVGRMDIGLDADQPCFFFLLGPQDCQNVEVLEIWTFGGNEYGAIEITVAGQVHEEVWLWVGPATFDSPSGADVEEFDYYVYAGGDLAVEAHTWSAVKSIFR